MSCSLSVCSPLWPVASQNQISSFSAFLRRSCGSSGLSHRDSLCCLPTELPAAGCVSDLWEIWTDPVTLGGVSGEALRQTCSLQSTSLSSLSSSILHENCAEEMSWDFYTVVVWYLCAHSLWTRKDKLMDGNHWWIIIITVMRWSCIVISWFMLSVNSLLGHVHNKLACTSQYKGSSLIRCFWMWVK